MKKTYIKNQGKKNFSRRNFISTIGAVTAAFTIVPSNVLAGRSKVQPSDMVNVAGVGVGHQGSVDIQNICAPDIPVKYYPVYDFTGLPFTGEQLASNNDMERMPRFFEMNSTRKLANVYALCDVDHEVAGYLLKGYPKAKKYTDWREMLEKEPSIDAVVVATPDHNHAPIAAAFIRERKHVYVQKPLCKTVFEARKLAELAKEYDIVSQQGNQGHANEETRQIVEWAQAGVIGHVREVHVTSGSPSWPQGDLKRPAGVNIPKHINYDVWTGPAPVKPYNPMAFHFYWHGLWDYGTGELGDFGAHRLDSVFWALNLGRPVRVYASSSPFNNEYFPWAEMITYEFPARGLMPPVKLVWYDGGLKAPRPEGIKDGERIPEAYFVGEKGFMSGGRSSLPQLIPEDPDFMGPNPWIPRTGDIYEEWINAIKNGTKTTNDFSFSAPIVESFLLGNVAVRAQNLNIALEYDAVTGTITNSPEANEMLHYEYREGWSL